MFVSAGARERLLDERRKLFAQRYVEPMVAEAARLRIDTETLVPLVRESEGALDVHAAHAQGGISL